MVLFLSDGEPNEWEAVDFTKVQDKFAAFPSTRLLTYALGSSADEKVLKKLACDNYGVFYPVEDDDNLADVMAGYYTVPARRQSFTSHVISAPHTSIYKSIYTLSTRM